MHPLVSEVVLSSAAQSRAVCDEFLTKYGRYLTRRLSQMKFGDRQQRRTHGLWTASKLSRYDFSTEATCNFYTKLGRLLLSLRDVSQTANYTKMAVGLAERLYGPGSAKLVTRYNNYGAALSDAGDRAGADEYYNKALEILAGLEGRSGTQSPHGVVLSNIASRYSRKGQFKEAEEYYKKALDVLSAHGEHEQTAMVHRNLGRFYMKTGKLPAAYEHLQSALRLQLDAGRERSTRTIDIYRTLGEYHRLIGQYEEAKRVISCGIDLEKELTGGQNRRIAALYHDLGTVETYLGDDDGALLHLRNAEEICRKVLPAGHADILSIQHARGLVFLRQKNFAEAAQLYQDLYAQQLKKYPDANSREIASTYINLSSAYRGLGDFLLAEEYAQKGLAIFLAAYGEQHQTVATVYSSLGETQRMAGHLDEAIENLTRSLEIRRRLFGEGCGPVALVHWRRGAAYRDRGDGEMAIREYAAALEIYRGESLKAQEAGLVLNELLQILDRLGRVEEARRYRSDLERE